MTFKKASTVGRPMSMAETGAPIAPSPDAPASASWERFDARANVTSGDRILAPLHPLTVLLGRTALANLARYRSAYRNYVTVSLARIGLRPFPVEGRLRDGRVVPLARHQDAQLYSSPEVIECFPEQDLVRVRTRRGPLSIHGGWLRGDVHGVYVEDVNRWMPVEGRDIVDVGASVGDSPLYFAAKGARRVVALEPWPPLYARLKENVESNGLGSIVTPIQAAIGSQESTVRLDATEFDAQRGQLRAAAEGAAVPVVTLKDLAERFDLREAGLKLDCEGGEYDAILGSTEETLRRFAYIQMEYHYGYLNLARKLEASGFRVRHDRPFTMVNPALSRPTLWMGFLSAQRLP